MSLSGEYAQSSYEESYEIVPKSRTPSVQKPAAKAVRAAPKVVKVSKVAKAAKVGVAGGQQHGKDKGCRKEWISEEQVKVCEKVPRTRIIKRCRTVVKYKTVVKRVKINVETVCVQDKECCRKCNDAYCKPVCKWVDVCVNGNSQKKCNQKGSSCCSGKWISARRIRVCKDVRVDCHRDVKYIEQYPVVKSHCEYVEVELKVACFETEEYEETVTECDIVCHWKDRKFDDPNPKCPTC